MQAIMNRFSLVFLALVGVSLAIDCPSEGQYFYEHPTRCSKFIECNNGVAAEQDCFGDLVFNPEAGYCDFASNYPCEDKPEPIPEGPVGECPPVNGEFVHFLTDSTRCEVFYMCDWGTPIKKECPDGLHFSPILWVCDHPYRANCLVGETFM